MVYEIQPRLGWDEGRAVLCLLKALGLGGQGVLPVYLGGDITGGHVFQALALAGEARGSLWQIRTVPGSQAGTTAGDVLGDGREVRRFLAAQAR